MKLSRFPAFSLALAILPAAFSNANDPEPLQLLQEERTFGWGDEREWREFAHATVHSNLVIEFSASANSAAATLVLVQENVREGWPVLLNGKKLGELDRIEERTERHLEIPPDLLQEADNILKIQSPGTTDDIQVGAIRIYPQPLEQYQTAATLSFTVQETAPSFKLDTAGTSARAANSKPSAASDPLLQLIPSRLTIVSLDKALIPLQATGGPAPTEDHPIAVRPGTVYTATGKGKISLPAGRYLCYAGRGPEYSIAEQKIDLTPGQTREATFSISRAVNTTGWISSDTHTHTFTFSRHGDASIEERVITLAAEHVEFPIATDHNILTDYRAAAKRMGVESFFTPVIGVEVTTSQGHFNVFPVEPDSRVPNFRLPTWPALFDSIRQTPGVQVAILNHPSDLHAGFRPFAPPAFHRDTGQFSQDYPPLFDCVELINSSAQQPDWREPIKDWFALLNAGHRVFGVASSDSHDVNRYIVGQGRTYLQIEEDDPAAIDIDEASHRIKAGRTIMSMGLFLTLTVDSSYGPGQTVPASPRANLELEIELQHPSWIHAEEIALYLNGRKVRTFPVLQPDSPLTWTLALPRPEPGSFLIAIAHGPGVRDPFWPIPRPYQRSGPDWNPVVLSITNPVFIE